MLVRSNRSVWIHADLDRATGRLRRRPHLALMQPLRRCREPRYHGYYARMPHLLFAVYAADGELYVRIDDLEWPVSTATRAQIHRFDGVDREFVLLEDREPVIAVPYCARRPSVVEHLDPTSEFDPFEHDFPLHIAEILDDDAQVAYLRTLWGEGLPTGVGRNRPPVGAERTA